MDPAEAPKLPPGRTPWDPINGLRVGALTGGLFGAAVTAVTSFSTIWLVAAGGLVGGIVGYMLEKRRLEE